MDGVKITTTNLLLRGQGTHLVWYADRKGFQEAFLVVPSVN